MMSGMRSYESYNIATDERVLGRGSFTQVLFAGPSPKSFSITLSIGSIIGFFVEQGLGDICFIKALRDRESCFALVICCIDIRFSSEYGFNRREIVAPYCMHQGCIRPPISSIRIGPKLKQNSHQLTSRPAGGIH